MLPTFEKIYPFPDQERFARSAEHARRFDVSTQKSESQKNAEKISIDEKNEERSS
jgi:hypothetical protein